MSNVTSNLSFEEVKSDTYAQKIYHQLKEKILSNSIPTDTVLRERDLAEQLGVSRSPVRDALRMLEHEGWVKQEGRNKIVRMMSRNQIRDIIMIRRPLELMVFDLLEESEGPIDLSGVCAAFNKLENSHFESGRKTLEYFRTDIQFHIEIARLSGNAEYVRLYESFAEKLIYTFFVINQPGSDAEGHRPFMNAIVAGDYAKAKDIYSEMLEGFEESGKKHLETC